MNAQETKIAVQSKLDFDISSWAFFRKKGNLEFYESDPNKNFIYEGKITEESVNEIANAINHYKY